MTAITFLGAAQERVHRDIAPVLRATVLERLDQVTGSRYVDCRVDPESLEVEVADGDGRWRPAGLLSHGTAEQLYLLLRLALARLHGQHGPRTFFSVAGGCRPGVPVSLSIGVRNPRLKVRLGGCRGRLRRRRPLPARSSSRANGSGPPQALSSKGFPGNQEYPMG